MLASLPLSDVYLTGYHAARLARVQPGLTVIGDGAVDVSAVLAARSRGAERIILMGRHTDRTDLGVESGASDVVAERGADGVTRVMDLTHGEGSHVVIEAVSHSPAGSRPCAPTSTTPCRSCSAARSIPAACSTG